MWNLKIVDLREAENSAYQERWWEEVESGAVVVGCWGGGGGREAGSWFKVTESSNSGSSVQLHSRGTPDTRVLYS